MDIRAQTRRFESVFRYDGNGSDGKPRFRINGSGVQVQPTKAPMTWEIVLVLERSGIAVVKNFTGSPANADAYHLDSTFMDGGLSAMTGNYMLDARGAWIVGEDAVTWIAHRLGLQPAASLRGKRPREATQELKAAYESTDFVVLSVPETHLKIGELVPTTLADLMAEHRCDSAALITAWNPFSHPLTDVQNRLRQKQLLHDLRGQGLAWLPAEGRDPTGKWAAEASFLVLGLSLDTARELLARYQQHALVWISESIPIQLLFNLD